MEVNNDEVICPNCVTQFRAIPVNVQDLMRSQAAEIERLTAARTALQSAIKHEEAQTASAVGTVKQKRGYPEGNCFVLWTNQPVAGTVLYAYPAPTASGEREALIARLRVWGENTYTHTMFQEAADMLAADAQELEHARNMYEQAVQGRSGFRQALREARAAQQVAVPQDTQPDNSDDLSIAYMSGLHEGKKRANALRKSGDAHEIWAAAQLTPGEGIEDGVARVEALFDAPRVPMTRSQSMEVLLSLPCTYTFIDAVQAVEARHGIAPKGDSNARKVD